MYKYAPDLEKILEIICAGYPYEPEEFPYGFEIFQADLDSQKISYHAMVACLKTLKDDGYLLAPRWVDNKKPFSKKDEETGIEMQVNFQLGESVNYDNVETEYFTGSRSGGALFIEGRYIANGDIAGDIWSLLYKLKDGMDYTQIKHGLISFNEQNGLLFIKGEPVRISKQGDFNNSYYIAKYIFNQKDLTEEFSYKDMITNDVLEIDADTETYRNAGRYINTQVKNQTKKNIDDFVIVTNKSIRINSKYLES